MKMTYASAFLVAVLGISGSANAGDRYRSESNSSQENLRYGLIGNGTGMGTEDTTSKGMTDNNTLADPKAGDYAGAVQSGALSAPIQYDATGKAQQISFQSENQPENLRYGLIGSGTGLGTEVSTGAFSAPIQSGTTGDSHQHGAMDHSKMGHTAAQMHDAQFLDKFTQHHKDAIKMSEMAIDKAQNPELKKMAQKMVKGQTKDIEQMKKWRKEQYASVPATNASVPEMDISPLERAEGTEFDRHFASMMAKHHEDGIAMANADASKIENRQVKKFAQTAAKNQTKEKQHLAKLAKSAEVVSGTTKAE